MKPIAFAISLFALAASAAAQPTQFAVPPPAVGIVTVSRDVPFGAVDGVPLRMDVFRPRQGPSNAPVLIFSNAFTGADRMGFLDGFYRKWAEFAASRGVVAILADLRLDHADADTDALLDHLVAKAAAYGGDPERIAIYGASANVTRVLPLIEDPAEKRIKAGVIYYGSADVDRFRLDLPLLLVRAGLDRPPVNVALADIASRATAQNAPVTLMNHAGGYHGFEALNPDQATRDVMEATIAFVRQATAPDYLAALRVQQLAASAAGHMLTGNAAAAADAYRQLIKQHPDDPRLSLSYGEALLAAKRYAEACAHFDTLRDQPIGPRDRGLPAARACLLKGDSNAAIGWLQTIPRQFIPANVQDEPVFAPLKDRADFKALFAPPN